MSCLEVLIEHNADLNIKDTNGDTALALAVYKGHVSCVKVLLQNNADLNITANDGATALIIAVINEHIDCVKVLLEKKPVSIKNRNGKSAHDFAMDFDELSVNL